MTNPTDNVFTVKPLEWEEIATGIKAKTIFGDCHVECFDRTGAQWWLSLPGGKLTECCSKKDGKAKAEAWYFSRLLPALEPVKGEARGEEPTPPLSLFASIIELKPPSDAGPTIGTDLTSWKEGFYDGTRAASHLVHYASVKQERAALAPAADAGVVGRLVEAVNATWANGLKPTIKNTINLLTSGDYDDAAIELSRWLDEFDAALALAADAGNAREKREVGNG